LPGGTKNNSSFPRGIIIFPAGFSIPYSGAGGELILKPYFYKSPYDGIKGTIIFKNDNGPQIDFTQSTNGSISLFYNPVNSDYRNEIKFYNKNIALRVSNTYCRAFMLVSNNDDLQRITCNSIGNYALCSSGIRIYTGHQNNNYPYSCNYGKKSTFRNI